MINSEKKIAYIFYEGRDEKLHNAKYSKEFFYGYKQVIQHFNKTQLYEVTSSNISTKLVYLDKVFFKTFRLQFNISKFLNKDIINIFKNFDSIVLTNFGIAMSVIPIISIINRKKRKKIIVINSGLLNFHEANNFQKKIRLIYLQYAFKNISHLVFTSKAEFQAATQLFPKYSYKFICEQYCTDYTFWSKNTNQEKEYDLLFIGNDSGRDFELLRKIINEFPQNKFCVISKNEHLSSLKNKNNVELISGNWRRSEFTDEDIRDFYKRSRLTILPIKDTIVASGQSVTLQSIAAGTPVLISDTIGFWDKESFLNNRDIFFVDSNTLDAWVTEINELFKDDEKLSRVSTTGQNMVQHNFHIQRFNNFILGLLKK